MDKLQVIRELSQIQPNAVREDLIATIQAIESKVKTSKVREHVKIIKFSELGSNWNIREHCTFHLSKKYLIDKLKTIDLWHIYPFLEATVKNGYFYSKYQSPAQRIKLHKDFVAELKKLLNSK